jgi:hypothetical protein
MAEHPGRFDHPAQLDFAPLAPGAVRAQGRFEGVRGFHELLVREPGLLQLLSELPVLFQPVAFQEGNLLLDGTKLLGYRRQGPQNAAVLLARFPELPVLHSQQPPLGFRRGVLRADLRESRRNAVEIRLQRHIAAPHDHVHEGRPRQRAEQQHQEGQNHCKRIHAFTVARRYDIPAEDAASPAPPCRCACPGSPLEPGTSSACALMAPP